MEILLKKNAGLSAAFLAVACAVLLMPFSAFATTCGTGSNISFTDIGGGLCQGYITSIGAGTFTVPSDWNSSNNQVACIGSGGAGEDEFGQPTNGGNGGGGGAYASTTNVSLTPGGSASYVVANTVTDTYFNGAASTSASVSCAPGKNGSAGGTGGLAANSTGTTKYDGGSTVGTTGVGGGGGGGAAGPSGAGKNGGSGAQGGGGGGGGSNGGSSTAGSSAVTNTGGAGGKGTGGSGGGTGGSGAAGGNGSSGGGGGGGAGALNLGRAGGAGSIDTAFDATHGAGGGGGGGGGCTSALSGSSSGTGNVGGTYGGGGGGGGGGPDGAEPCGGNAGGAGGQGLIVLIYSPLVPPSITTSAASANNATSATFNGSVTATGGAAATTCGFAWGTNSSLSGGDTATTTDSTCPGSTGSFTKGQVPLVARTTYYFRAYGINTGGTGYGSILSFSLSRGALAKPPNNLGLVGYWPMNEATSTQAGDFSGNGNTGTLAGGTLPSWTPGKFGGALTFGAANNQVTISGPALTTTHSISMWVYPTAGPSGCASSICALFALAGSQGLVYTTGNVAQYIGGGAGPDVSSGALPLNTWSNIVVSVTGGSSTMYINGASVGTGSNVTAYTPNRIGGDTTFSQTFPGKVDEVRVYSRALSAAEALALYRNGTAGAVRGSASSKTLQNGTTLGSGLMGLWSFDGNALNWTSSSAGVAYDLSGNSHTGTLTNMTRAGSVTIGKLGQALSFDGSSSYIDLGSFTGPSSAVTIAAWVKKNANVPWASILDLYGNENLDCLSLGFDSSTGANLMFMANNPAPYSGTVTANSAVPTGQWTHVAASSDGSTVTFYVNGVADGSASIGAPCTSGNFYIGANFPGGDEYLSGAVDDVRLYNRALSASEISQLYKLGKVLVKP